MSQRANFNVPKVLANAENAAKIKEMQADLSCIRKNIDSYEVDQKNNN